MNWQMQKPNGCGPWWVSERFKDNYFIDACNRHDLDYFEGKDQHLSDKEFYKNMKQIIRDDYTLSYWQKKLRYAQAWAYYHLVRRFGFLSHKKGLDL